MEQHRTTPWRRRLEPDQCPRCGKGIPDDEHRGEYQGALSRLTRDDGDVAVFVCSSCGEEEGLLEAFGGGATPMSEWWANQP